MEAVLLVQTVLTFVSNIWILFYSTFNRLTGRKFPLVIWFAWFVIRAPVKDVGTNPL